jgi:hypothetical protein
VTHRAETRAIGDVAVGSQELRMIQHIEELGPEFRFRTLSYLKRLVHA